MLASEKDYYIGATIKSLRLRITGHKNDYKQYLKDKSHFCSSFEIIKNDNFEVIEIEKIKNETEEECREREQWWINFYGKENLLNKFNANGFDNERNKLYMKNYNKEYYEKNREALLKQKKDYYEKNKK